jgi:transposase InsO family protein
MPNEQPRRARRTFDKTFKRDVVALLLKGGQQVEQLAQEMGVSQWNLRDWREQHGPSAPARATGQLENELRATDSRHDHPIAPNRLAGTAALQQHDQAWVTDITDVPTEEGWLYVAGVMDRWSRRVVGLAMAEHLRTELVGAALQQAHTHRRPASGCLHHTDRGYQYASAEYRRLIAARRLEASMSRAGNCYDNAAMESIWSTLKNELVHRQTFATRAHARAAIFGYVEVFYNRQRLHSAHNRKSPVDFENQNN